MIDFHCHLDLFKNPTEILNEIDKRKTYVLAVTTTPKAWQGTKKLIGDRSRVRIAIGLHPELVGERFSELALLEHFLDETDYVGEIGLDGSPHLARSYDKQLKAFDRILNSCSIRGGRILSIHSRRAVKDVLDCLEKKPGCGTPILHWFTGSDRDLERAIKMGCWFSVGPAMLKSSKSRNQVSKMPKNRILTETDAPFGKVNNRELMPWDVRECYEFLAKVWCIESSLISNQLRINLTRLVEKKKR